MVIEMNKHNEKISAFLDNGIHSDELMSFSLSSEAEDAKVAQRYQMVGEALRGELSDSSFIDVSQAVREALADENIATQMDTQSAVVNSAKSSQAQATDNAKADNEKSSTGFFDWSSLFKPAAGMAMAALVAVVMVTTLSDQGDDFATNSVATEKVSDVKDNTVATQKVTVQPVAVKKQQSQFRTVANVPNKQTEINTLLSPAGVGKTSSHRAPVVNPYINQHLEFARQNTMQGRMPYVRSVGFEQ